MPIRSCTRPSAARVARATGADAKHLFSASSSATKAVIASGSLGASSAGLGRPLSPDTSSLVVFGVRVTAASLPSASRSTTPPLPELTFTVSITRSMPLPVPGSIRSVSGLKLAGSRPALLSALAIAARKTSTLALILSALTSDGFSSSGFPFTLSSRLASAWVSGEILIFTKPSAGRAATIERSVTVLSPTAPVAVTMSGALRLLTLTEYLPSAPTGFSALTVLVPSVTLTAAPAKARPSAATPSSLTLAAGAGVSLPPPPPQATSKAEVMPAAASAEVNRVSFMIGFLLCVSGKQTVMCKPGAKQAQGVQIGCEAWD